MRILLVEDDDLLARGLLTALCNAQHRVEHVHDGSLAVLALAEDVFDAVVLDLGLPQIDGTEVLRHLRGRGSRIPVLILSARDAPRDRIMGLDLGADDYLTKPFELDELLARLRVMERRNSGLVVNQLTAGALTMDLAALTVTWDGQAVDLQRREFMLLKRLAEKPRHIFTRSQLEEAIYGWGDGVESNTIDVHVHNLRKKLTPEIIKTIRGVGYRLGLEAL